MKPLTDEDRKRLTLYLGECWHENNRDTKKSGLTICSCGATGCDAWECIKENRDFTTYEDLGALKDKLVENGEWEEFVDFAYDKYVKWLFTGTEEGGYFHDKSVSFNSWLFRPESCGLVAEYLEQKEEK